VTQQNNQRRALTSGEQDVLRHIQELYGPQNTDADVSVDASGNAFIFIKDCANSPVMVAVLTNLSKWYADGLIKSADDLRQYWLTR
jgi:hypothetical protein